MFKYTLKQNCQIKLLYKINISQPHLVIMSLRINKRLNKPMEPPSDAHQESEIPGSKHIQRLIKPKIHLWLQTRCQCVVCEEQKPILVKDDLSIREYKELSKKSHEWLKKVLIGLTEKNTKTLKIFLPDLLFVLEDGLQIFSTNKKDYRIMKYPGTTPIKAIFPTLLRLRKQYKGMLEQNFRKTMIDEINPKFMHVKYFQRLLPSHFHDGDNSRTLNSNKSTFKTYILNDNHQYIISAIEEHKLNEKQPFATIRYEQGHFQLLNQKEFELISISKLPEDVIYVQSFIKSKEAEAIVVVLYSQNGKKEEFNEKLWKKAQVYVMVLLGGLGKYDEGYDQLQNFQDEADEMMKLNPSLYALYMTYQIVHYLAMASKIYIRHLKIKWIINDIDNIYLQEIIQFQTQELSKRPIRYKLPPIAEVHNFYQDSGFFVEIHREMKKKKQENLEKVKRQLKQGKYPESGKVANNHGQQSEKDNPELMRDEASLKNSTIRNGHKANKRTISYLQSPMAGQNGKLSLTTKESTMQQPSNLRTISQRHRYSPSQIQSANLLQDSPRRGKGERRSISAFGEIITRHEQKMIDRQRRLLNRSLNQNKYNTIDTAISMNKQGNEKRRSQRYEAFMIKKKRNSLLDPRIQAV